MRRLLTITALSMLLGACGAPGTPMTVPIRAPYHTLQAAPAPATPTQAQETGGSELPFPFLADVNLTQAQTSRIQAIAQQYAAPAQAQSQQQENPMRALLLEPRVDQERLISVFRDEAQRQQTQQQQFIQMLAAVRDVLTDQQRQAAADAIRQADQQAQQEAQAAQSQQPTQSQASAAPQGPQLNLTLGQQALFKAAMPEPPQQQQATQTNPLADFMVSGDSQALAAALAPPADTEQRFAALARAYASLSLAQRSALVNYQPPSPPPEAQGETSQAASE